MVALHRPAGLEKNQLRDAASMRDTPRARAIAGAHIEQRSAALRQLCDNQPINARQVRPALAREAREYRRNTAIGRNRVLRTDQNVNRAIIWPDRGVSPAPLI
jgi:hypothetical protein